MVVERENDCDEGGIEEDAWENVLVNEVLLTEDALVTNDVVVLAFPCKSHPFHKQLVASEATSDDVAVVEVGREKLQGHHHQLVVPSNLGGSGPLLA